MLLTNTNETSITIYGFLLFVFLVILYIKYKNSKNKKEGAFDAGFGSDI